MSENLCHCGMNREYLRARLTIVIIRQVSLKLERYFNTIRNLSSVIDLIIGNNRVIKSTFDDILPG